MRAGITLVDALQLIGAYSTCLHIYTCGCLSECVCTLPLHSTPYAYAHACTHTGALLGLAVFAKARRLPWAHWKGLGGKVHNVDICVYYV